MWRTLCQHWTNIITSSDVIFVWLIMFFMWTTVLTLIGTLLFLSKNENVQIEQLINDTSAISPTIQYDDDEVNITSMWLDIDFVFVIQRKPNVMMFSWSWAFDFVNNSCKNEIKCNVAYEPLSSKIQYFDNSWKLIHDNVDPIYIRKEILHYPICIYSWF